MPNEPTIRSPDDPALDELAHQLAARADALDAAGAWPADQLALCGRYGVCRWFVPRAWGGLEWSELDILRGYLRLSAACLTTTFILTQRTAACRRIVQSDSARLKDRLLPGLASGQSFSTVGISHLTTSRRHLARPVMVATPVDGGFVLDGFSPWVTGGGHAETIVTGAVCEDGRQILVVLPTDAPGVTVAEPARLVGLAASHTGEIRCRRVRLDREWLLAGPVENVFARGSGTGGLSTSALAIGLASTAIDFLQAQAGQRPDLGAPAASLLGEHAALWADLVAVASGDPVCSADELRSRANSIALRSAQAALAAAKGSGYVVGHPAGRWCREALFFLVWSCPQGVMAANLCELAGLGSED